MMINNYFSSRDREKDINIYHKHSRNKCHFIVEVQAGKNKNNSSIFFPLYMIRYYFIDTFFYQKMKVVKMFS